MTPKRKLMYPSRSCIFLDFYLKQTVKAWIISRAVDNLIFFCFKTDRLTAVCLPIDK